MSSSPSRLRTLVEEDSFRESIEALGVDIPRLDEALAGVTFSISRKPEFFPRLGATGLRRAKIVGAPGLRPLSVWFRESENDVHLISVTLAEEP